MVSTVLEGGVVTMNPPPTGDGSSAGDASPEVVVIDSVPEYYSASGAAEEIAEVVGKDVAAEMTKDELVSHSAMADYDSFATRFSAAVVDSGLDADDLEEPLLGVDDLAAASSTDASFSDDAQDAELDKYPLIQLPD
jgi:hypothetical protein